MSLEMWSEKRCSDHSRGSDRKIPMHTLRWHQPGDHHQAYRESYVAGSGILPFLRDVECGGNREFFELISIADDEEKEI